MVNLSYWIARAAAPLFLFATAKIGAAQDPYLDSLKDLIPRYHLDWRAEAFDSCMATLDRFEARLDKDPTPEQLSWLHENRGRTYGMSRQYARSTYHFIQALKVRESSGDSAGLAQTWKLVADQNFYLGNMARTIEFGRMAHGMALRSGDTMAIGTTANGLGYYLIAAGGYDEAERLLELALRCNSAFGDSLRISNNINNLGMVSLFRGDRENAIARYRKAAAIRYRMLEYPGMGESMHGLLRCDTMGGRVVRNKALLDSCLHVAMQCRDWNIVSDCHRFLSEWHRRAGEPARALEHLRAVLVFNDSIGDKERIRALLDFQDEYFNYRQESEQAIATRERERSAREVRRQKTLRNVFLGGFALVALFAGVFFAQRVRIAKEKRRSDQLLLNILPEEIAAELKAKGEAQAVQIDEVTVLFTDFKGFTALSETMGPSELVRDLNECFSAFDRICERHGIEKIKTIGDAYMAAGGLPTPNTTHATDVVKAALEMRDHVAATKERKLVSGSPYFEIRIGIHTGPVVAGIVGVKKFQYDIWGDTVNTASRMESSGEVGQVNISEATYVLVKDARKVNGEWSIATEGSSHSPPPIHHSPATAHSPFTNSHSPAFMFTARGKIHAKGKGEMEMYYVHRGVRTA